MALSVYQNQLSFDLIIPGWESTFHLYPGEYVGGEYYDKLVPTLTDVTDQNIPVEDIKYIYPGSTDAPNEGGAIDSIIGVAPIQASTLLGVTTISLDTLTGSLFGPGEVVKSINGIADAITITNGAGITVDTTSDTVIINNTQLGLTATYATPPLYLELGEGNVSLSGSIAITAIDSGGAVALQATAVVPTPQLGTASVSGIDLGWNTNIVFQPYFDRLLTGHTYIDGELGGSVSSVLWGTGALNTVGTITSTEAVKSDNLTIYRDLTFDPSTGLITELEEQTAVPLINFNEHDSFIETEIELRHSLSLAQSTLYPDTHGQIEGYLESYYTQPFISLTTPEGQTTPLIELKGGYLSGTPNSNVYLNVISNALEPVISLHGDGIITAKTLNADTVNVTTLNANNIYVTSYAAVGPTTVNVTTAGPQTIMGDCSLGPIVIQLPDLNAFDKSLSVTIIKTDLSNNTISIVNGLNSTINGSTLAVDLVDQYETITLVSNGIKWYKIGAM